MKTFPIGGVHPSDNKQWSKSSAIEVMELPDVVNIPLAQHIGAPATAIVKKGDTVDFLGIHILHHSDKIGSVEIRTAVTVIGINLHEFHIGIPFQIFL